MKIDFQTWMRSVWTSIVEPSDSARKVIAMDLPREALWTALALVAVLNVILIAATQILSPVHGAMQQQAFALSPFGLAAIIGIFFVLFVFGTFYAGQMMGGSGTLAGSLAIIVWFQSISLTLEAIQLLLVLVSPMIAALYGLLSMGALIWCFMNFVNVLHDFKNLGKALAVIFFALVGTAFIAGVILTILGLGPVGGMT
jgi:hypothetical protein